MVTDFSLTQSGDHSGPAGYIYWPNAGVFIHPMALQQQLMYYQRMTANNNLNTPQLPSPTGSSSSPSKPSELRRLAPKIKARAQDHGKNVEGRHQEVKMKRNASEGGEKTPSKRKRSAIFIPPIPAENQTNPATEVSICKFKFTGGAKPSLQEKKMLSVSHKSLFSIICFK